MGVNGDVSGYNLVMSGILTHLLLFHTHRFGLVA